MISILIIAGLFALRSSRKQKKAQENARKKANAFREATESLEQAREKIPFNKDEWTALLKEQLQAEAAPKPKAVQAPAKPAAKPAAARPAQPKPPAKAKPAAIKHTAKPQPPKPAAPVLRNDHDEPEGSISTQGESAAEHAKHIQQIRAEEEKLRLAQQTLQEVRSLNRRKLQDAVVMSEILGKPVSLRPRGYR